LAERRQRNVYKYAAMSRASVSVTPLSGIAVFGSTLRGCRIQLSMFAAVFG
jgi:hypothetical protein